jgi:membrane carboxypeptidase/penicillin-binding protein
MGMPSVSQIIKFRRRQRSEVLRNPLKNMGLLVALLASLVFVILTSGVAWFYHGLVRDLPSVDILPSLLNPPNGILLQPTRIYDRTHEHVILTLENPAAAGKQYISIEQNGQNTISQAIRYLMDATVTELDPGFWQHGGYSLGGITDGTHPTLAQKLALELLLGDEQASLRRNLRERLLAAALTARYGREKVLEWYLNSVKYGEFIYGVDAAAHVYFGKSANDLTLAEAAMLTALAETPVLNLDASYQALKQQEELIIQRMLVYERISIYEAQAALQEVIQFKVPLQTHALAPAFTQQVLMQLNAEQLLEKLSRGAFEVVSSLDYDLQVQALCASQAQIARTQGLEKTANTIEGHACQADVLLPPLQGGKSSLTENLAAEAVIIDPQSGEVLAWVGGDEIGLHPASPAEHPAGSILSPLMYLAAFTRGLSPASLLWDIPAGGQAIPTGVTLDSYHGPVSLRNAFIHDYQGAAAQVIDQIGLDTILLTEKQFGIQNSSISEHSATSLQSIYLQPVSLLQVTQAYAVLANHGLMVGDMQQGSLNPGDQPQLIPTMILKINRLDGQTMLDGVASQYIPIVSSQIAYLTTNVLSDKKVRQAITVEPDTLDIGRPVAVKTSLAGEKDDAWVVGYTPQLVVGVWMGQASDASGNMNINSSAGIWHAITQYALQDMPLQDFSMPAGISTLNVCEPSGMLATPLCPQVEPEVFLRGNEPTQEDDLYQKFAIDRETGLLATIFTPRDQVDEQVFLMVPPQVAAWAEQAGVASPPNQYDSITDLPPVITDTQFVDPHMFDDISGKVAFIGRAAGEGFSYYRLQVGEGLNPQEWLQLGGDVDTPVGGGTLGEWDTSGLSGVYIVELMVVRQDQRVDRALLQVRIDNIAPQVYILSPREGQQYDSNQDQKAMLNIQASDDVKMERVEFFVDGKLISTLFDPPYTILWQATPGLHNLQVKGFDSAGNQASASSAFRVIGH